MSRSPLIHTFALATLAILATALPSRAGTIPIDALPLPNRLANADIVVSARSRALRKSRSRRPPRPEPRRSITRSR